MSKTMKELQYTCKKCGYKTNRCNDHYKHINQRKNHAIRNLIIKYLIQRWKKLKLLKLRRQIMKLLIQQILIHCISSEIVTIDIHILRSLLLDMMNLIFMLVSLQNGLMITQEDLEKIKLKLLNKMEIQIFLY